jgi:hypothetical protein
MGPNTEENWVAAQFPCSFKKRHDSHVHLRKGRLIFIFLNEHENPRRPPYFPLPKEHGN